MNAKMALSFIYSLRHLFTRRWRCVRCSPGPRRDMARYIARTVRADGGCCRSVYQADSGAQRTEPPPWGSPCKGQPCPCTGCPLYLGHLSFSHPSCPRRHVLSSMNFPLRRPTPSSLRHPPCPFLLTYYVPFLNTY